MSVEFPPAHPPAPPPSYTDMVRSGSYYTHRPSWEGDSEQETEGKREREREGKRERERDRETERARETERQRERDECTIEKILVGLRWLT